MIDIKVERRTDDPKSINMDQVPSALTRAIIATVEQYPTVRNDTDERLFDRLFENLYNCRVEYADGEIIPSKVVWPNDRDYIMFLLRWS